MTRLRSVSGLPPTLAMLRAAVKPGRPSVRYVVDIVFGPKTVVKLSNYGPVDLDKLIDQLVEIRDRARRSHSGEGGNG